MRESRAALGLGDRVKLMERCGERGGLVLCERACQVFIKRRFDLRFGGLQTLRLFRGIQKLAAPVVGGVLPGEVALSFQIFCAARNGGLVRVQKLGQLCLGAAGVVAQCMEQIRISPLKERNFMSLSDGQKQRVLLAKALCQEPEIIVLDEPTSFLDIRYKLELLTVLKRMVRENDLAVLLSLHELELAERISDTVVCVAGDRIDRIGPPEEIFTRAYIAKLYKMEHGKYDPCFDSLEFVP